MIHKIFANYFWGKEHYFSFHFISLNSFLVILTSHASHTFIVIPIISDMRKGFSYGWRLLKLMI